MRHNQRSHAWEGASDPRKHSSHSSKGFPTGSLLKVRLGANVAINFGQKLWNQEVATLIRVSEKDETRAWELFIHYEDKGFSFTDCTSFALMERLEIKTVFAFDEHFLQYGKFVAI